MERRSRFDRRLAGASAILAAPAQVGWAVLGGLRRAASGPALDRAGLALIVAWNALLIPVALDLGRRLGPRNPRVVGLATACGAAASLLWGLEISLGYGRLEVAWVALSAVWWLGIGSVLRGERSWLGIFTVLVSVAAALDAIATALEPRLSVLTFALIGGWKLPLALAWNFWVGLDLLASSGDGPSWKGRLAARRGS